MSDYPRFSHAELARRRAAVEALAAEHAADHVLVYGANRFGSAVPWLTRWPVTREAVALLTPGERPVLWVDFYNHVPNATAMAAGCDVRGLEGRGLELPRAEVRARGGRRVGVIGPLPWRAAAALQEAVELVALDAGMTRLRLRKSEEELAWLRTGCALTDAAVEAVAHAARPGVDERELGAACEAAYLAQGGTTHIHYFAANPMASGAPGLAAPAQWPTTRRLQVGDALVCEISAAWWDHPGQVLRTFAIAADPTPRYAELHAVATAAFDAIVARVRAGAHAHELVDASRVIEDAGFTTRDDLVHGFVGGYLPPVLGSSSRELRPAPDLRLEAGMTIVVQPNVCTRDETAGVQVGELLLVTDDGHERLHTTPHGLRRVGD